MCPHSHGRLGLHHPDPKGEHLRTLQHTLKRLKKGQTSTRSAGHSSITGAEWEVKLKEAYVWVEYMSVPQPDASASTAQAQQRAQEMERAQNSMASYLEWVWLMIVLAPPASHSNLLSTVCTYGSWLSQGWW